MAGKEESEVDEKKECERISRAREKRGQKKKDKVKKMEKYLQSQIEKEVILWRMWRKEAERNFDKVKKEKEEYGIWKRKIENKIFENAAENIDLVKRVEKLQQEKQKRDKEVERMLREKEVETNKLTK